jgi:hypothetical protein
MGAEASAAGAGKAAASKHPPARGGRAEGSGKPTKSDNDRLKAEGRAQDRAYQQAYTMGQAGEPPDPSWDQPTQDAYDSGVDEAATQRREERGDRARQTAGTIARPGGGDLVNDGAGFLLGLIVYALVINYLRGGTAQARGWIAAKFINKPRAAKRATGPAPRGGG